MKNYPVFILGLFFMLSFASAVSYSVPGTYEVFVGDEISFNDMTAKILEIGLDVGNDPWYDHEGEEMVYIGTPGLGAKVHLNEVQGLLKNPIISDPSMGVKVLSIDIENQKATVVFVDLMNKGINPPEFSISSETLEKEEKLTLFIKPSFSSAECEIFFTDPTGKKSQVKNSLCLPYGTEFVFDLSNLRNFEEIKSGKWKIEVFVSDLDSDDSYTLNSEFKVGGGISGEDFPLIYIIFGIVFLILLLVIFFLIRKKK